MIEQMQQYVKASSQLRLIALHSLDPTHKNHKDDDHANRTAAFWTMRGFQDVESEVFLHRLTRELKMETRSKETRSQRLTSWHFYKRFEVPFVERGKGTMPMVWLPMPSTPST